MEIMTTVNVFLFFLISITLWFLVGLRWNKISDFFHTRYSYFELSFILLYFVEQLALSYFIYEKYNAQIIAGVFSIIIITTAAIQNKCWESRDQRIRKKTTEQKNLIDSSARENKKIIEKNKILETSLEKTTSFIDKLFLELEESEKTITALKKK
jgi:hypothetical protein